MGSAAIKITEKWQFTIPARLRTQVRVKPGDYLEPEVRDGLLILKPRKRILIDPDQAWFWTEEWQEGEREVQEEIQARRVHRAETVDELMKNLRKKRPHLKKAG